MIGNRAFFLVHLRKFRLLLTSFFFLSLAVQGFGQDVVARLDIDRRDPQPRFIEYVSADGGIAAGPRRGRAVTAEAR